MKIDSSKPKAQSPKKKTIFILHLSSFISFLLLGFLVSGYSNSAFAQNATNRYSILFGWKTEGSHELLAKQAAAFKQIKDFRSLAISFGALLGPTLIVKQDNGAQFLEAARQAGLDYIIPAAPEFMFGVEALRKMAESDSFPRFISANVVDEKTRRPMVDPYAMWYVAGQKICIVALSDTNIIRNSKDENVAGIDIVSYDEALNNLTVSMARENPDIVIVAGRMDRTSIVNMAVKYPFVNIFITNNQAGGFSDPKGTSTTAFFFGKPVFIGPESGNQLGIFSVKDQGGVESKEFMSLTLGDAYPPDKEILDSMNRTINELKQKDTEETAITRTGGAVTSILKDMYKADVVLLERQSLFYYPLKDSLTIFNVRSVIRPFEKLALYDLKGSDLKSIGKMSISQSDPSLRLLISGMTADGRVDSIPVIDDSIYKVLTTTHLRSGGNGYSRFKAGTDERFTNVNMLAAVERYIVDKDERLRRAAKQKIWTLNLNLTVGSNFNRVDVDVNKPKYGSAITTQQFKDLKEQFFGYVRFASENNLFNLKKDRHILTVQVDMRYKRQGYKPPDKTTIYTKTDDYLMLKNTYLYNISFFSSQPIAKVTAYSILYSGKGKHPIRMDISTGLQRQYPKIWLESASVELNASRNYFTNLNTLGTKTSFKFKKTFAPKSFLTDPAVFTSTTDVFWDPTPQYHYRFSHINTNQLTFKIYKQFGLDLNVRTYSYRDNTIDKATLGFVYDFYLTYMMQWKL
ncbi:MAG: hypothetical protein Q8O92_03650 [Candidatus Latescibacter sp.]|nr:hypothetical protein [Candidatus Latescibacter sp.]